MHGGLCPYKASVSTAITNSIVHWYSFFHTTLLVSMARNVVGDCIQYVARVSLSSGTISNIVASSFFEK